MKIKDISYYLFESYKDAVEKFSQEEDKETVNQYLDSFKQLVKKGIVTGQEKDIGYWIKQGWDGFKEFVDGKSQEKTKGQVKKFNKKESIIAHEDDEKMIVIPLSKDASCYYGKNTKWCTSSTESKNYFIDYFYARYIILIYVLRKDGGKKYAAAYNTLNIVDKFNYFDELDDEMSKDSFEDKTGIKEEELENIINEYDAPIKKAMNPNNASENEQIELLKIGGNIIKNIENPSEKVQLTAVTTNPFSIRYIENPSEKVQEKAIQKEWVAIKHIDNPSEEVQMVAVKNNGYSIKFIKNSASEEVQIEAVKKNPESIQHIEKPSEKVQLASVSHDGFSIEYIDNPTDKVQWAAIEQNGSSIQYMDNPTEEMMLKAVKNSPSSINYINNPSEDVQEVIVNINGSSIFNIDNPSEKIQLSAIKNSPFAIKFIYKPTEKAKELHQEIWGSH